MEVKIIGNGVWGNALAVVLRENCCRVSFWNKKEKIIKENLIILSIPTQSLRDVFKNIKFAKENCIIINTSKGIERNTHLLPFEITKEFLGDRIHYFSLIGPSFAEEVKEKMPTLVNLGYTNNLHVNKIKNFFQTNYFRVRVVKGVEVLELAAAFKNVYAIACGLAEGLGFGVNTRTKLILIALEEFYRLNKKMKNKINFKMFPATLGDLILTCSSTKSRNFKFGKMLSTKSVKESLAECKTVEGFHTVFSISYYAEKNGVKLYLAQLVKDIIESDNPKQAKKNFLDFIKRI